MVGYLAQALDQQPSFSFSSSFSFSKGIEDEDENENDDENEWCSSHVEVDALRERKLAPVVDRVGGAAHIALPRIRAGFPPAAGLLLAAEGAADLRAGGADVHVGDAAVRAGRGEKQLRFADVGGEDRRGETLRHSVVERD